MEKKFSHLDDSGNPTMVDVSQKSTTIRKAIAQAIIVTGEAVVVALVDAVRTLPMIEKIQEIVMADLA